MITFIESLPIGFQIYIFVGIIVFLIVWKSFAYRGANRISGSMSGHTASSYKDRGIKPTLFDYLLCLGWAPPMIMVWPIVLIVYFVFDN